MSTPHRWIRLFCMFAALVFAGRSVSAQDVVVVVSAKNADELLGDIRYVLGSAGSAAMRDLVDGMIEQGTQGKGLVGVDRTKPVGGYMAINSAGNPELVIYVPVSDPKGFRQLLAMYYPKQKDFPTGVFSFQAEDEEFFGRFVGGHCFLAVLPTALNRVPDPTKFPVPKHDISIEADLTKVPDEVKDDMFKQLEESFASAQIEPPQPLSETQALVREYTGKVAKAMLRLFVTQSDRISANVNIDAESKQATAELSVVPRAGTELAQLVADYRTSRSSFAGVVGAESLGSVIFATPLSQSTRQPLREAVENAAERRRGEIDASPRFAATEERQAAHALVNQVVRVFQATGETGRADALVVLNSPAEGKAQFVAASKISQSAELNRSLETFAKRAGQPGQDIKIDVAQHGDMRIHAFIPELSDADRERFGDGPGHLAIGEDAIYVALGGDSLALVREAIDMTGQKDASDRPPVSVRAQLSPMVALFIQQDDPSGELARQAFLEVEGGDQFSLDVVPTDGGARLRLEVGEAFLRHYSLSLEQQLSE